jgi:AcrR family transcriptional regulator
MSGKSTRNRDRQKLATRQRILEAALLVFSRDGIMAAKTADIAKEAAVSHGNVFAHFGNQEALISAVIEGIGMDIARRIHELSSSGLGVRELLAAFLRAIGEKEGFYARLVAETPSLPPRARESLVMIQSAISFHLAPAVEAGTRSGAIRPMQLHLLFNTWIGLVDHYLVNRELFAPEASVIESRGSELLDHFMKMISS